MFRSWFCNTAVLCFYDFVMIKRRIWIRGCVWVHRESGKSSGMYTFWIIVSVGPPSVSLIFVSSGHCSLSANWAMISVVSLGSPLSVIPEEPFCHIRAIVTSHAAILTPTTWATSWCVSCVLHGVCVYMGSCNTDKPTRVRYVLCGLKPITDRFSLGLAWSSCIYCIPLYCIECVLLSCVMNQKS